MRIFRLLTLACLLGLTVFLGACDAEQDREGGEREAVPVTATSVSPQRWTDTVRALGTATAPKSVVVTAKVSETVQNVLFESGDKVMAGAPLVVLSGQQQQAALAEAEAAADEAEKLYRRQAELASQQLIARAALDAQRAIRDAARAEVAQIRAQLDDRIIRAPFTGVLGLRQVSPGSLVTPGTPIATLDELTSMYVDFPVPEVLLSAIEPGQALMATSVAYPGREFIGEVATVDTRIDRSTRAFVVRGEFDNPDQLLRPGMLLQVTLRKLEREALMVPEISVVQVGNSSYIYRIAADSTVQRVDVQVGARRDGMAEILSGLKPGDRIVVDGTGKLRPGMRVDVRPEAGAQAPGEVAAASAGEAPPAAEAAEAA